MVGGDRIDRAVGEPRPYRVDVGTSAQRRVDLERRVVARQEFVGEADVVRCRLGGHREAIGLGPADEFDAPCGRQVQEVRSGAREPYELDVTVHHELLRQRRPSRKAEPAAARPFVHHGTLGQAGDLAVLGERDAEPAGVLERPAHEERVLHAIAVVGEDAHADRGQFGEGGELGPVPADRDRGSGEHLAQSGPGGLLPDEVDHFHAVLCRIGVGHRHDRGEAAECGGSAAGLDRLGLLLAGLAQVRVQIDEPGADDAP